MVWYCKYQFRYIIGLWSQKWKKMCVSSRSPHLFFEKLFYWRAMSLSLVRLDSVRRIIEVNPMKFLSNVLKTLSTLELHAEKQRQIPNGISKHFIHWSIYELFYCSPRKKQNWNNRRIGQMNSNFFNKELVSSFFLVNLSGGHFFVTADQR